MSYCRAEEVLPMDLIIKIQQYTDGVNLYIPRKEEHKKEWGTMTTYRQDIEERDDRIFKQYQFGCCVRELAENFYLSEKSIQRIIRSKKKQDDR